MFTILDDSVCDEKELEKYYNGNDKPSWEFFYWICPFVTFAKNYDINGVKKTLFAHFNCDFKIIQLNSIK